MDLLQEMLLILTIANRQNIYVFVLTIKNRQMLMFTARLPFKKGGILVVILGFPHFVFWKKNLWTSFVLHNKEM